MTKVVCIAGAHRSGTSMLTRLLHRSGLYLGPESELMPAAADNPDGFWEHLRFVKLNDEVLNAAGAAWDLPPRSEEAFDGEHLKPMRAKAQLLTEDFADQPIWGWKDPRNSLTLRFWQSLLPNLKTVIIFRNPLEVAYSMHKRNGTSYALGLRLWEIYNRRLLADTVSHTRVLTNYAAFFTDPRSELRRIVNFVGLENGEDFAQAAALIAAERRHTAFTMEQMIDAGVAGPIIMLYKTLLEGAADKEIGETKTKRTASVEDDQLRGAGSQLRTSVPDSEDIRAELARRRGAEIQHREEIARHQKTINGLRQELAAKSVQAAAEINRRDGRIEELQKAYAHLDQVLQGEQRQRNELFEKNAQVRERFAQTNELLQKISIRLADFESRNASLTERLRKQLLEMKRLLRFLDQVEEASILLRRSRRWKMANPFAALLAAMTAKPLPGFGHLDKNVEKYRLWRANHSEIDSLADEIQALRPREILPPYPDLEAKSAAKPASAPSLRPPRPETPVSFAKHDEVEISIIIPVYNQFEFTHACLAAVRQNSGEVPYEVIVVDDASTDATREVIGRIPGIVYLRGETNAGFIASCNRGAAAARGKYLVFLNNDTTVTTGWLAALRETFDFAPDAGLVGSKLVYPDGRLQEAGGIIWQDGSGWNRGKFQDSQAPQYNFLREVDYCSAASIMVPKSLFDQLGGFNKKYDPAYYEDTDLAFRVADTGRKVLYQPLSVVVHYEGITGGTDISAGAKKYQEINRATFTAAWSERLARQPTNGQLATWERRAEGQQRILVIDHHLPLFDRDSGSLRMFQILKILHQLGHRISFMPDNLVDISPYGDELRKRGIEVLHYPYAKTIPDYLQLHGKEFDVVILSRCDFARKHIADVRLYAPQARLIFDTVDLHFLREEREADLTQNAELRQKAAVKRQLEYDLIDEADATWVVSPAERDLLQRERPDKTFEIVSNIVDVPGSVIPFASRRDILFIGSFQHPPNTDAVLFFIQQIFPLVQNRLPVVRFYIIGDKAPPEVIALASEQVIVTGFQPDVAAFFDTAKLSVAPLRYGAGIKGKINQSMGFGVPVVATSAAVEGMDLTDREDVMIADTTESFAAALIETYQSEDLWNRLSKNGLDKTKRLYSFDAARRQLDRLFNQGKSASLTGANESVGGLELIDVPGSMAL